MVSFLISFSWANEPLCPTQNGESISGWRDAMFKNVFEGKYTEVKTKFKNCYQDEPSVPQCLKDLKYYNESISSPPIDVATFNELYDQSLKYRSEEVLPTEFLVKDKDGKIKPGLVKIPDNIFELVKKNNWKAVAYKTRDRGGFDPTHNLLIVAIPGVDKDIFLQIGIDADEKPYEQIYDPEIKSKSGNLTKGKETLTMITVDKTVKPFVGQLRKMTEDEIKGQYKWSNSLAQHDGTGLNNCFLCHTNPLRPISPVGYRAINGKEILMSAEKTKNIDEINQLLTQPGLSWGQTKHSGKEVRFGPTMDSQPWGWAPRNSVTRTQKFIESCAANREAVSHSSRDQRLYQFDALPTSTAKVNWQKVASSMNCIACHNGTDRGILHNEFQSRTIAFKVAVSREMPLYDDPDVPVAPDLTMDERLALLSCLKAEREAVRDEWRKSGWWVKRAPCTDETENHKSNSTPTEKSAISDDVHKIN